MVFRLVCLRLGFSLFFWHVGERQLLVTSCTCHFSVNLVNDQDGGFSRPNHFLETVESSYLRTNMSNDQLRVSAIYSSVGIRDFRCRPTLSLSSASSVASAPSMLLVLLLLSLRLSSPSRTDEEWSSSFPGDGGDSKRISAMASRIWSCWEEGGEACTSGERLVNTRDRRPLPSFAQTLDASFNVS